MEFVEPNLHRLSAAPRRHAVGGKERELARGLPAFRRRLKSFSPTRTLAVVALPEIPHVPWRDFATTVAPPFDDRPRPVNFAVLASLAAL
jgi:hypothetical protein